MATCEDRDKCARGAYHGYQEITTVHGVVHYEYPRNRALACNLRVGECDHSTHDPLDVTCEACIAELVRLASEQGQDDERDPLLARPAA